MLNYLWAGMIIVGICYGSATGNITELGDGAISAAGEAVSLAVTLLGIISMWTGLMKIAEKAGLIAVATRILSPFIHFMFPEIPKGHKALEYISTNIIANIFGLGWAATPAGLKAMDELSKLNNSHIASNAMCTFLVINISSLQLIPVNMIAYRTQYGSANPTIIVAPAIVATLVKFLVSVAYCKIKCTRIKQKKML